MNKGNSGFSNYKNSSGVPKKIKHKNFTTLELKSITSDRLEHSNKGEFTQGNRPTGGGHGQDNLDYLDKNKIRYEITYEYNNGVRVGNLPTSTNKMFRTGGNHTWFPKNWSSQDIADAANFVASTYKGNPSARTQHTKIYKNVKVTVIFGENGSISTVYPNKDQGDL